LQKTPIWKILWRFFLVGHIAAFSGTTQSLESHGTLKLNNTTNRLRADEYDENIAKQMLAMSAATYSVNDPMPCVQRLVLSFVIIWSHAHKCGL
jgi:hypothetical protein